ncbi:hypothetical protein J2X61_004449 [Bacillus sp. 3255]|nr:hypothetical protein [Bacillus sp. 3255]
MGGTLGRGLALLEEPSFLMNGTGKPYRSAVQGDNHQG